jgi:hypothetical protein
MKRPPVVSTLGLAAALIVASPLTLAGSYQSQYGGANVATILLPEHDAQAAAFGLYLQDIGPENETDTLLDNRARPFRNKVEAKLNGATIARAEYRLKSATVGEPMLIIHAASGPSIKGRYDRAKKRNGSGSSSDELEGKATRDNITHDAAEAPYYPPDTSQEIRARNFAPYEGGVIATREVDGKLTHFADAELKIAGALEHGFLDGSIPRGGELVIYVNQEVCDSCRANLVKLAETYDVDVNVYHLAAKDTTGSAPMLREARIAGSDLLQARKLETQFMLKDAQSNDIHLGTWSSSMRRVERLERGLGDLRICL